MMSSLLDLAFVIYQLWVLLFTKDLSVEGEE